jgi:hypothetical protein
VESKHPRWVSAHRYQTSLASSVLDTRQPELTKFQLRFDEPEDRLDHSISEGWNGARAVPEFLREGAQGCRFGTHYIQREPFRRSHFTTEIPALPP